MAVKGDYDDIMGFLNDPDFEIQVACELYCSWKELSIEEFTVETVLAALTDLISWATLLPPGLPLITFYGQAFALFVGTMQGTEAHRRAAVHADERSDDCSLLCVECNEEPDECFEKFNINTWGEYLGEFDGWQRYRSTALDGTSKLQIDTGDADICCYIVEVREVTSLNPQRFHIECGDPLTFPNIKTNWPVLTCVNMLSAQLGVGNTSPFTVEFKFSECP